MSDVATQTPSPGSCPPARKFGPITRTEIVRYQGASGDFHPAHHDDDYARRHGYPGVFSLGMLCAGYMATFATDWLGPSNVRKFRVRFLDVTWPDDLLTCSARLVRTYREMDENRADLEIECRQQTDSLIARAYATFRVDP
jgi:acyl dehydratase